MKTGCIVTTTLLWDPAALVCAILTGERIAAAVVRRIPKRPSVYTGGRQYLQVKSQRLGRRKAIEQRGYGAALIAL
jgi:hypothetical protein